MSERQASGFTAVNGKESRPDGMTGRLEMGRPMVNGSTDRPDMAGSKSVSSTEPSPTSSTSLHHPRLTNGHQHHESIHTIRTRSPSPGKRKRTVTDDGRDLSGPNSHYDLSPPRPSASSLGPNGDRRGPLPQESSHGPGPSLPVNGTDPALSRNSHNHDDHWSAEREGREVYQTNGVHQQLDPSDVRMAEALQQETRGSNTPRGWNVRGQHDEESPEQYGSYSAERTPSGAIQSGPKRKRVFSNRTKTGCLTCRKRKKKCDEMHPLCNNCMKGGFTCEGYSTRTTWPKQTNGKTPVPLQSKDGYVETENGYAADSPSTRQGPNPYESAHSGRPAATENEHQSHYVTSPSSATTRNGSYPAPSWSNGYAADSARQGLPPIASLTRDSKTFGMNQMPDLSHGHTHSSSQPSTGPWPTHHPSDEHRIPFFAKSGGPVNSRSLQGVARDSLNMEESSRGSRHKDDTDHKANMLNGLPFLHSSPVLVEDRKRCKMSLQQFHDAENPTMNIGDGERHRKLVDIFVPPPNLLAGHKIDPSRIPIGSFGHGSVVETPFRCQYGYNIKIAENVFIGENCSIVDACGVIIGAKTWIGQNVQILTAMAQTQMQARPAGGMAMWKGKRVHIEEDVHIGAGVIIYPGVTIGQGAQIEPGTIVKQDWPRWKQGPMMDWTG